MGVPDPLQSALTSSFSLFRAEADFEVSGRRFWLCFLVPAASDSLRHSRQTPRKASPQNRLQRLPSILPILSLGGPNLLPVVPRHAPCVSGCARNCSPWQSPLKVNPPPRFTLFFIIWVALYFVGTRDSVSTLQSWAVATSQR